MLRSPRLILVLLLLPTACRIASADPVDRYIREQMQKQHIPGLSLAVVRDGKIIKAKGYGYANLELNVPATPQTVYQLASVSKQFTAAAILLLVQDGKVGLDDRIGKYLDGAPPNWKEITLRHLLTHTSGLQREGILTTDKTYRADFTRDEMLKSAAALPLLAAPGEKYSYSNLGFNLLGMVVEKASGKSLADFLHDRIFQPLDMSSSRINDLHAITPNRACGYEWANGGLRVGELISPTRYSGAGALLSNVLDLAKWDAALYTDRLLTAASRKQMWTPAKLKNGSSTGYGFGWGVAAMKGHANVNHNGLLDGFQTQITRFVSDRLTVIVLINQTGSASPDQITRVVARDYLPALRPKRLKTIRLDPRTFTAYTGRYEYANNFLLTITTKRDRLAAKFADGSETEYRPISLTTFWEGDEGKQMTPVKNSAGEVTGLILQDDDGKKRTIPRIGPLISSLTPVPDPDPALTQKVWAVLKAMQQGGKAIQEVPSAASGVRKDFAAAGAPEFAGAHSLSFLAERDIAGRGVERHGGKVNRILYYKLLADKTPRYVLVYFTPDNLVTDEDVVDD